MELQLAAAIDQKAKKDIVELHQKIQLFQSGKLDGESFRAYRLARGIYGQRQDGVNMIRIKLPFGSLTPEQLVRIADLAEAYGSGNLHATTRQDIQLHYVKLADAPQLWAKLEEKDITLREACGNTIRNLTASPYAGIDPEEYFDVSPYANAMFQYFLRNPVCQNLGRKFKIAFSSSDRDAAFTFIHDLGFIPRMRIENGKETRGFKVLLAGGLGAQPFAAHPIFEFMGEREIIPFTEACLRIFDRYGERAKRHKARLKYLIQDMGVEAFLRLVEEERKAIRLKPYAVDPDDYVKTVIPEVYPIAAVQVTDKAKYEKWLAKNIFKQKQEGFYAVRIKLSTGNLDAKRARQLAAVAAQYAADDMRITVNQGVLMKFVRAEAFPALFQALEEIGLAEPGFDTLFDITACPGTDTCNLGISSSVGLAVELERMLAEEFKEVVYDNQIKIKISGCMNGCAHHAIANIGFHGMSMKVGSYILPAMQVLLGGGINGSGSGTLAEKVIKLPAKNVPDAVRRLLTNYEERALEGECFNDFYQRMGKNHFYNLLKPLADLPEVNPYYLQDWGDTRQYQTKIGIGECAVPMMDMVAVVLDDVRETLERAREAFAEKEWVDAIYLGYTAYLHTGKALLLTKEMPCNTHFSVLKHLDEQFIADQLVPFNGNYVETVLQINKQEPSETFATAYLAGAEQFYLAALTYREGELRRASSDPSFLP